LLQLQLEQAFEQDFASSLVTVTVRRFVQQRCSSAGIRTGPDKARGLLQLGRLMDFSAIAVPRVPARARRLARLDLA
jgi:hypothetical protein